MIDTSKQSSPKGEKENDIRYVINLPVLSLFVGNGMAVIPNFNKTDIECQEHAHHT